MSQLILNDDGSEQLGPLLRDLGRLEPLIDVERIRVVPQKLVGDE